MHDGPFQSTEHFRIGFSGNRPNHAARHQKPKGMNGIAGIGDQNHVTGRCDGLRHIGKAFFGAKGCDNLGVGIEFDAKTTVVISRLCPTQTGQTFGGGIAVGAGFADRLDHFLDHMTRRGQIGIAHAQINDIRAIVARRCFDAIDLFKHIGWQALDAMEIIHNHNQDFPLKSGAFRLCEIMCTF